MAFEQTGSVVDDIIATPSAFVVQPTFGGYYSFAQMEAAMDALVAAYPTLVQKTSWAPRTRAEIFGVSKFLTMLQRINQQSQKYSYMGLQHAREAIGKSSMIFFMQYLCETYGTDNRIRTWWITGKFSLYPCMNPDGWEYNRNNGEPAPAGGRTSETTAQGFWGVDLNRNWSVDWSNCSAPIVGSPTSCGRQQ